MTNEQLNQLRNATGYFYLGSPYSRYPHGIEAAFEEVCRAAAFLIQQGVSVYAPIAMTHPVAVHGGIDPLAHSIWLPIDQPLMEAAAGLIVCKMEGWQDSYGLAVEQAEFARMGKPVFFMEWEACD